MPLRRKKLFDTGSGKSAVLVPLPKVPCELEYLSLVAQFQYGIVLQSYGYQLIPVSWKSGLEY